MIADIYFLGLIKQDHFDPYVVASSNMKSGLYGIYSKVDAHNHQQGANSTIISKAQLFSNQFLVNSLLTTAFSIIVLVVVFFICDLPFGS